jgi:hypothetical protein
MNRIRMKPEKRDLPEGASPSNSVPKSKPSEVLGLIRERKKLVKRLRELDVQQMATYIQPAQFLVPPPWRASP